MLKDSVMHNKKVILVILLGLTVSLKGADYSQKSLAKSGTPAASHRRFGSDAFDGMGKTAPDLESCQRGLNRCAQTTGNYLKELEKPTAALIAVGTVALVLRIAVAIQC
jgi:hypothetical protein